MKNIIYGVTHKPQKFTYQIKINDITYYYTGEQNEVYFIEEVCYKLLRNVDLPEISFDIQSDPVQFLVESEIGFHFVTINKEDDTIFYSSNEFSEEEVYSFISELIYNQESLFVVSVTKDEFVIFNDIINLEAVIFSKDEILNQCINNIKGAVKFTKYIKKHLLTIFLIILIIFIPFITLSFIDNVIIKKQESKLKVLKNKKLIKKTAKTKNLQNVVKFNKKYKNFLSKEDIVDSHKKDINKIISSLKIYLVSDSPNVEENMENSSIPEKKIKN